MSKTNTVERPVMPCPFCGETPIGPSKSSSSDERCGYNFTATISCVCGATISKPSRHDKGGWCNDTGQAVADVVVAWNARHNAKYK